MKYLFKQPFFYTSLISLCLLGLVISSYHFGGNTNPYAFGWTTPSTTPPGGNITGGGTPAGSTGYVQFNNAGVFGGDANLFWDNTNKRLGIGTANPNARLDLGTGYGASGEKFLVYNDNSSGPLAGTKAGFYMDRFGSNNLDLVFPTAAGAPGSLTIASKDTSGTTIVARMTVYGETGNVSLPTGTLTVSGTGNSSIAGNVGIGTTAPVAKFTINEQTNFSYPTMGTTVGQIHLRPPSDLDQSTGITFGAGDTGSGDTAQAGIYVQYSSGFGTKMYFGTTNSYATGAQSRMMIDHSGNVGIGTTTPGYKLDVVGDVRLSGNLIATANTLADCAWTAYTCDASQTCTAPKVVTGVERYTTGALCGTSPTQWYQMRLYCCNL